MTTSAEKSARYRAKDVDAYRAKKNALAKTPHHRAVRAAYAKKWRAAHKKPRKKRGKMSDEERRKRQRLAKRKYMREHRAEYNAYVNRMYHKHKHKYKAKIRDSLLKRKYGISAAEWEAMFLEQGSMCKICSSKTSRHLRTWHTDHCHKTGRVRGILCHVCNTKLGWFEDFRKQIEDYLK